MALAVLVCTTHVSAVEQAAPAGEARLGEARRWSHFGRRAHPNIDVDGVDGVAAITLDDGKVNAIGPPMTKLFSDALDRVQADDDIRAVVVRATGTIQRGASTSTFS